MTLAATFRYVPRDRGRRLPLDAVGAATLTLGATLVIAAATAVPQDGLPRWLAPALLLAGLAAFVLFVRTIRRSAHPFVSPRLAHEPSYVRSALGVFAQMFCLGTTLLGVPLHLTGAGYSTAFAGVVVFGCPAAMALLGPVSGLLTERLGPRAVMRTGLVVLGAAQLALALVLALVDSGVAPIVGLLVVTGVGVALVQTPAATGATRSAVGRQGAGLGLFNLIRFAGSALGAAWVAIALRITEPFVAMFSLCVLVAAVGFAGTFAGPSTPPVQPDPFSARG